MRVKTACIIEIRTMCQTLFGKVQITGCADPKVLTLCTTVLYKGVSWSEHMDARTKINFNAGALLRA